MTSVGLDAVASSDVPALLIANLELPAGERAVIVMPAASGFGVVPEAGRSGERFSGRSSGAVIGDDLQNQIPALAFQPFPGRLAEPLKDAVERWVRDDQAAGATPLAGFDHG